MASIPPESSRSYTGSGTYYDKQLNSTFYEQNSRLPTNLTIPSSDFNAQDATLVPQSDFDAFCSDIPQVDSDFDPEYLNIADYQSGCYTFPAQPLLSSPQRYGYERRAVPQSPRYTFTPARNLTQYPAQIPDDLASDLVPNVASQRPTDLPSDGLRSLATSLPDALAPSIAGPLAMKTELLSSDIPSSPPSSPHRLVRSSVKQPPPQLRLSRSFRSDVSKVRPATSVSQSALSSPIRVPPQSQYCDSLGIRYSPTHRPHSTVIGNDVDAASAIPTLTPINNRAADPENLDSSPLAPTHFPHKSPHLGPPSSRHAYSPHLVAKNLATRHSSNLGSNYGAGAHLGPSTHSLASISTPNFAISREKMGASVAAARMTLPPGAYETYALSPTLSEVSIPADDNEYSAHDRSQFPSSPVEATSLATAKIPPQFKSVPGHQPYHQGHHNCHEHHCHEHHHHYNPHQHSYDHPHDHLGGTCSSESHPGNKDPESPNTSAYYPKDLPQDYKEAEFTPALGTYPKELRWCSTVGPPVPSIETEDQRRKCKRLSQLPYGVVDEFIGVTSDPHVYRCLYSNCGRLFKRTYNLRSHIQTHLCDRPYTCRLCNATFVRPHDLRRHERCHSLTKPYLCPCGKGFNRQDALQRHRTRNICVGGIPSDDPKPKKPRGRPRTRRPGEQFEQQDPAQW